MIIHRRRNHVFHPVQKSYKMQIGTKSFSKINRFSKYQILTSFAIHYHHYVFEGAGHGSYKSKSSSLKAN
jgi:hypothetical protein